MMVGNKIAENKSEKGDGQDGSWNPEHRLPDTVMFSKRFPSGNVLVGGKIRASLCLFFLPGLWLVGVCVGGDGVVQRFALESSECPTFHSVRWPPVNSLHQCEGVFL